MPHHVWDAYFLPFAAFVVPTAFIAAMAMVYVWRRLGRRTRPSVLPTVSNRLYRLFSRWL